MHALCNPVSDLVYSAFLEACGTNSGFRQTSCFVLELWLLVMTISLRDIKIASTFQNKASNPNVKKINEHLVLNIKSSLES